MADFIASRFKKKHAPIDWREEPEPLQTIETLLGMPASRLFDPRQRGASWLYAPAGTPAPSLLGKLSKRLRLRSKVGRLPPRQTLADTRLFAWEQLITRESEVQAWTVAPPLQRDGDARAHEIVQGKFRDCFLVASLAAVGWWKARRLVQLAKETPASKPSEASHVKLTYPRPGKTVEIDSLLPQDGTANENLIGAHTRASYPDDEGWPGLWEKSWVLLSDPTAPGSQPSYDALDTGDADAALGKLVDGPVTTFDPHSPDNWATLRDACDGQGLLIKAGVASTTETTTDNESAFTDCQPYVVPLHSYTVLGCIGTAGSEILVVRDPAIVNYKSMPTRLKDANDSLRKVPTWNNICSTDHAVFAIPRDIVVALYQYWATGSD